MTSELQTALQCLQEKGHLNGLHAIIGVINDSIESEHFGTLSPSDGMYVMFITSLAMDLEYKASDDGKRFCYDWQYTDHYEMVIKWTEDARYWETSSHKYRSKDRLGKATAIILAYVETVKMELQ